MSKPKETVYGDGNDYLVSDFQRELLRSYIMEIYNLNNGIYKSWGIESLANAALKVLDDLPCIGRREK